MFSFNLMSILSIFSLLFAIQLFVTTVSADSNEINSLEPISLNTPRDFNDDNESVDEDPRLNRRGSTSFLRFGREMPLSRSGSFLRFGRSEPSFLRFGRNGGQFLRFGRRSQYYSPTNKNFLRFGRKGEFLRFG